MVMLFFFTESLFAKGFKMITTVECEGPGRCATMEENPLPCLPSIFSLAPDKDY